MIDLMVRFAGAAGEAGALRMLLNAPLSDQQGVHKPVRSGLSSCDLRSLTLPLIA